MSELTEEQKADFRKRIKHLADRLTVHLHQNGFPKAEAKNIEAFMLDAKEGHGDPDPKLFDEDFNHIEAQMREK